MTALERNRKRARDWSRKNRQRANERLKAWAKRNPAKCRGWVNSWRKKNGERHRASERAYRHQRVAETLLKAAKARAKRLKRTFNLTLADVVVPKRCPILGIRLKVSAGQPSASSPSLDRIDNKREYVRSNVIVVSHRANTLKGDASLAELWALARGYKKLGAR